MDMSPWTTSLIVFASVFGGALAGMALRPLLPEHHLNAESRDMMKLGMGMIGTISALVLGLLVASAKESYDAQKAEVTQLAAHVAVLDRVLAHYGPETRPGPSPATGPAGGSLSDRLRKAKQRAQDQMKDQKED